MITDPATGPLRFAYRAPNASGGHIGNHLLNRVPPPSHGQI